MNPALPAVSCAYRALRSVMAEHEQAWARFVAESDEAAWDQHLAAVGAAYHTARAAKIDRDWWDEQCHRGRPNWDSSCGCDWHEYLHQCGEYQERSERRDWSMSTALADASKTYHRTGSWLHARWLSARRSNASE